MKQLHTVLLLTYVPRISRVPFQENVKTQGLSVGISDDLLQVLRPVSEGGPTASPTVVSLGAHIMRAIYQGAKGISTRSKEATRGSWPYY